MNRFNLPELLNLMVILQSHHSQFELLRHRRGGGAKVPDEAIKVLQGAMEEAHNFCLRVAFLRTTSKIYASQLQLAGSDSLSDASSLATELRNILEVIRGDACGFVFLQVPTDRAFYVDNKVLLGQSVMKAFPSATADIREAGNCLAADCNTAGVFHLMRTVEWGLRALCVHLGFRKAKNKIRKSGTVSYVPIEYSEWEKMLDQLNVRVDAKMNKLKRGKEKQALQEFYYPALLDIRGIRDAWRNHVMHTRAEYNPRDADAVLSHVRRIMTVLATRVKEV